MITRFYRKSLCEISLMGGKGGMKVFLFCLFFFSSFPVFILPYQLVSRRAVIIPVKAEWGGQLNVVGPPGWMAGTWTALSQTPGTTTVTEPPTRVLWLWQHHEFFCWGLGTHRLTTDESLPTPGCFLCPDPQEHQIPVEPAQHHRRARVPYVKVEVLGWG